MKLRNQKNFYKVAGKHDKTKGVFVIEHPFSGFVYIGKSTGVGVAIRSAKSKLKKGKFHNKNIYSSKIDLSDVDIPPPYLDISNEGLDVLYDEVKEKYLDCGWLIANDTEVVDFEEPLDDLTDLQSELVNRLAIGFKSGNIIASEFDQYLKK